MLLDTNCLSAIADGDPALEPLLMRLNAVAVPSIVLGEYYFGVAQSRHRKAYEQWLEEALMGFDVLRVDSATARVYAELRGQLKRAGTPIPTNDLWISALALQHNLEILSRDEHFDVVPALTRHGW